MGAAEAYTYVDSTKIVGIAPTVHIPQSAYIRAEWILDQFISERANLDLLRDFHCTVPVGKYHLYIQISSMLVSWRKCEAENGVWYEPTDIHPIWHESHLYDEEGEQLNHDFDIHIIINKLTTH